MLSELANYGDSDEEDSTNDVKIESKPIKKVRISIPDLLKDEIDVSKDLVIKTPVTSSNGSTLLSILPQPQVKISNVKNKPIPGKTKDAHAANLINKNSDKPLTKSFHIKKNLEMFDDIYEVGVTGEKSSISDDENDASFKQYDHNIKENTNYFFFKEDDILENLKSKISTNFVNEHLKQHNVVHHPLPVEKVLFGSPEENIEKKTEYKNEIVEPLNNQESTPEIEEFNHLVELHKFMPKRDRANFQILPSSMENMQSMANSSIQFIEANADDILGPQEVERNLTKAISEDHPADLSSFKQNITQQQKRKHQITYLAYQAKEREYELQKQWAASKTSRQESRAKYGF